MSPLRDDLEEEETGEGSRGEHRDEREARTERRDELEPATEQEPDDDREEDPGWTRQVGRALRHGRFEADESDPHHVRDGDGDTGEDGDREDDEVTRPVHHQALRTGSPPCIPVTPNAGC